jgi:hypothetical protein
MKGGYTSLKAEETMDGPTKPGTWISNFRQSEFGLEEAPELDQVHVSGSSELTCSVTETVALALLEADAFKIPRKPGRDVDPDRADFGLGVEEIS